MNSTLPFISVVIPTFERFPQLEACVRSIGESAYPEERFEVVVVDDGSRTPPGSALVEMFRENNWQLLSQDNAGPAAARNAGAAQANGDILAFLDDDCIPDVNWLGNIARRHARAPECLIGGRTLNRLTNNVFSASSQMIIDIVYDHFNNDPGNARFFCTNNMALPKTMFEAVNGFDARLRTAEDRDLCHRVLCKGYRLVYDEEVIIHHAHRLGLLSFCKQHFNYGRGAWNFHRKRRDPQRGSLAGEIRNHIKTTLHFLSYPFRRGSWLSAPLWLAVLVLWQVVNTAGFLYEATGRSVLEPPSDV